MFQTISRGFSAMLIAATVLSASSNAAVPPLVNFQGRAGDASGRPLSGTVDLKLRYYSAATDPSTLYLTEGQSAVPLTNGIFSVQLGAGSTAPGASASFLAMLQANDTVYLDVAITQGSISQVLSPRVRLVSAPYAIRAGAADTLGGLDATGFLTTGSTPQAKTGPLGLTFNSTTPVLGVTQSGGGPALQVNSVSGRAISADSIGTSIYGHTTGNGGIGIAGISDGGSTSWALYGAQHNADAPAVGGIAYGSGATSSARVVGVFGYAGNNDSYYANFSGAAAVRGESRLGDGVQAGSESGIGVLARRTATTGRAPALRAESISADDAANAIEGILTAPVGSGLLNPTRAAVYGFSVANGMGGRFINETPSGMGIGAPIAAMGDTGAEGGVGVAGLAHKVGVLGLVNGPASGAADPNAIGVRGSASFTLGGTGVEGYSGVGGSGVRAVAQDTASTALEIKDGPIKVTGTTRTAFTVTAATGNRSGNVVIIDSPLTNGDPNAILIMTHNWQGTYMAVGAWYNTVLGKWTVFREDPFTGPQAAIPLGEKFNVLVIKQ